MTKKSWIIFIGCALIGMASWALFSYPDVSFVDLSIDRPRALSIAKNFLVNSKRLEPSLFKHATILSAETQADRYLQKTIGFKKQKSFFTEHQFDLFHWTIRFFKENEKEEFRVRVSSSTGDVIGFQHVLKNTADRLILTPEQEEASARDFLSTFFGFDFANYTFKETNVKKHDRRVDHSFVWHKKTSDIPWSHDPSKETAKLLTRVTISGGDILGFSKNDFFVPDDFSRDLENKMQFGRLITGIFLFLFYALIMIATFMVVIERHHLVMQKTKSFILSMAALLFILVVLNHLNNLQSWLYGYSTTSSLKMYFSELILPIFFSAFLLAISYVMPALAGESLITKNDPPRPHRGFYHYLLSSFLTRKVSQLILLGYLISAIMLGTQAMILHVGRRFFGVWIDQIQIPQLSSTYIPFLTAFIIALRASLIEETTFRLFGIHWAKGLLKNTILAVIIMSMIWGFGHAHYPIFPMWFRSIEVMVLGLLLSYVYLNFGILPTLTAHYLFNAFWGTAGFLFGKAQPMDFWGSLVLILLPLILAVIAFVKNRSDQEKPITYALGQLQHHNIKILLGFLNTLDHVTPDYQQKIKNDLIQYHWDTAVIEEAFRQYTKQSH